MTMKVLQNKLQITKSRRELERKGISLIESPIKSLLRKARLIQGIAIGDYVKSWDVLSTVNFLESHINKNDPILDIGSYASELIVMLHKMGYSDLTGTDLDPNLYKMPYQNAIRYEISDFMHTKFMDGSFRAITSISVIEHGFDGPSLFKEMSRILSPSGYLIVSFDYWPEKIDTTGLNFFNMDWIIFSKEDIERLVNEAAHFGLFPVAEMNFEAKEKVIHWGGRQYTFAWMVFEKAA